MPDEEYKKTFAKLLAYYMKRNNYTRTDLIEKMGVSSSTASDWCNAKKLPRMDKIESIAAWLNVEKSDLLTEKSNDEHYYINDDARDMAEFLYSNPEYKVLFDASRNVKKEDIDFVKQMLDKFKDK